MITAIRKIFYVSMLASVLVPSAYIQAEWVVDNGGTRGHTSPRPYRNNDDTTATLSIPDARSLDVTISGVTERNYDFLEVTDASGNTRRFSGTLSDTYTVTGNSITIHFTSDFSVRRRGPVVLISMHPTTPPIMQNIPDQTAPLNKSYTFDLNQFITQTDEDPITNYSLSCSISGLNFNSSTGILSGTADQNGIYNCSASAQDIDGPSNIVSFNIEVTNAVVQSGAHDFYLINPPSTHNMIGNFVILGNTAECVTTSRTQFGAQCTDDKTFNDNNYMVKYIDIDNDGSTWNSSSSNFTLPSSYDDHNGTGVVWAGLFWQGAVNNFARLNNNGVARNIQRRATPNGSSYTYTNITQDSAIDIPQSGARNIMIKFDNDSSYTPLSSETFYFNTYYSQNRGGSYAAYTDITKFIQDKHPAVGKHTITISNITTNEGRENWTGDYAGWSVVVIYKEQGANAKARNISIYNGYAIMSSGSSPTQKVKISGFKLPKTGDVSASFGAFAGEGEWVYGGGNSSTDGIPDFDRMVMSKNSDLSSPDTMPGANDPDNIFDAILANIDRDDIRDNKQDGNNNGIDVEYYDVSSIMKKYRDANQNISTVYIGLSTSRDYITPSMMAFSAELYMPRMCYSYDLRIGNYIKVQPTDRINREFKAHRWGQLPLLLKTMLRSEEADFGLEHAKLHATFTPSSFVYRPGESKVSPDGISTYIDTVDTDVSIGQIAVGTGITQSSDGGTIGAKETTYSKMYYDFDTDEFEGRMNLAVDANITFVEGEQPTHYTFSTDLPLGSPGYLGPCASNPIYDPIWGTFNVENNSNSADISKRLPLMTQIVGKPYKVNFTSYIKGPSGKFDQLALSNTTVEFDLIDASTYENNASTGFDVTCQEPQPIIRGGFVHFEGHEKVEIDPTSFSAYNNKIALHNTAFRIWVLTKKDSNGTGRTIVNHNCSSETSSSCFDGVYADNYETKEDNATQYCTSSCVGSSGSSCYDCLRKYFAQPMCSRDNFAIRPEGFRVAINDTDEENLPSPSNILAINDGSNPVNTTKDANLSAGYQYQLKIEATLYGSQGEYNIPDEWAKAYYKRFEDNQTINPLPAHIRTRGNIAMLDFNDSLACADTDNHSYEIIMQNGKVPSNNPAFIHGNVGRYSFWITDSNWTRVDQGNYKYKTIFDPACSAHPSASDGENHICYDCVPGSVTTQVLNGKLGCTISSSVPPEESTAYRNDNYVDLDLNYNPYSFDLSDINASSTPNSNYLLMTNYDNDPCEKYDNADPSYRHMNTAFEGKISAKSKTGIITTNFTDSCAATDVTINLTRSTTPTESNLSNDSGVKLQQYLNYGISSIPSDHAKGLDANLTLYKAAFDDTLQGEADMQLYAAFDKPVKTDINAAAPTPVNPIKVSYKKIKARDDNAASSADMGTHIPKGDKSYDHNQTFLYAKAAPLKRYYEDVADIKKTTPMYIEAYCDHNCSELGLTTPTITESGSDWYLVDNLIPGNDLGTTDYNTSINLIGLTVHPTIELNNSSVPDIPEAQEIYDVSYENDATQTHLIVHIQQDDDKPATVKVNYCSSPWLVYDIVNDFYRVKFIGDGAWAGVGHTGHVVNTGSSSDTRPRMNW